jgi:hypothetical protein
MLLAMAFVTVALLYVSGPAEIKRGPGCPYVHSDPDAIAFCHSHHAAAWERVWYAVVGEKT